MEWAGAALPGQTFSPKLDPMRWWGIVLLCLAAACGDDGDTGGGADDGTAGTTGPSSAGPGSTPTGSDATPPPSTTSGTTGVPTGPEPTTDPTATSSSSSTGDPGPACDIGEPLDVPDETWTTIFTPGTACANAGEAGFVVNPSPRGANLLIFFRGGGACFNEKDCASSLLDGFTEQEAIDLARGRPTFDRNDPDNPFADWDYVFVPYCTGDFHSGGNVASYGSSHVGHANMQEHLTRIVPTFCDAPRVVVTGTSAGGFGAAFEYPQIHELFGNTPVDLIADSGPYMTPEFMPTEAQDMIDGNWGFRANMPAGCGDCATRWDALYTYIAERWPNDRMSFLSFTRDPSIQGRFRPYTALSNLDAFEAGLNALADDVLVPLPNFRVFFLEGTGHVLFNNGAFDLTQNGTTLGEFIQQQLDGDAAWADIRP